MTNFVATPLSKMTEKCYIHGMVSSESPDCLHHSNLYIIRLQI